MADVPRPNAVEYANGKIGKSKTCGVFKLAFACLHKERSRLATPSKSLIETISRQENFID